MPHSETLTTIIISTRRHPQHHGSGFEGGRPPRENRSPSVVAEEAPPRRQGPPPSEGGRPRNRAAGESRPHRLLRCGRGRPGTGPHGLALRPPSPQPEAIACRLASSTQASSSTPT